MDREQIKEKNDLKDKIVQISIDICECTRDSFQEAVERNGKTVEDVLTLYMKKYVWKQSELQRNREKKRQSIG
ncbi:hypothetical protein HPT25_05795 [Bacillus sp. BRMEA1]|uniref:hypothetical protein n=1 Tax=Neobacillus endophyticus TaxID=2738405 RepID=UPI0015634CB1|nr:hypothetical protein [Neobacillus endophyticus]NRD77007.1 hypothetical protein [Neobacillus endophyticus]